MLLLLGAVDAGGDWRDRLVRAVTPSLDAGPPAIAASLDIWLTPPEYTGLPPQFLRPENRHTIPVPTGSKLLAQVHGGGSAPQLALDGRTSDFAAIDQENFRAEAILTAGRRIEVSQAGAVLGSWPIRIIPDHPPTVAFAKPPGSTAHKALRIDYRAADDYGVESIEAVIRRPGGKPGAELKLDLPLPGLHLKQAQATSYHDLTPNPWAGLPVELRLVAKDALGQKGESPPLRMTLPERVFTNPVARAIIDQRKELAADPASRLRVAEILGDLRSRPELYRNDIVVFLALRVAQERLRLHHDVAAIGEVEQLLWDTALRIEDGQASLARNELRRLQRQLQNALAKNAPDREVDRLMSQLKAGARPLPPSPRREHGAPSRRAPAAGRPLADPDQPRSRTYARPGPRAGQKRRPRPGARAAVATAEHAGKSAPGAIGRDAAGLRRGAADDARHARVDAAPAAAPRPQLPRPPAGRAGADGSPRQSRRRTRPNGAGDMGDAAQQEALRRSLGEIMRRMGNGPGDIPDPLGRAERAMHDAAQALRGGVPGEAIGPQTDALDQLQQAEREFARQMQQRLGSAWGEPADRGNGTGQPPGEGERDPLGRPAANGGAFDQGDVKIPDQDRMDKARQILDELRRRAGESYRPQLERDYLDRLLKQF